MLDTLEQHSLRKHEMENNMQRNLCRMHMKSRFIIMKLTPYILAYEILSHSYFLNWGAWTVLYDDLNEDMSNLKMGESLYNEWLNQD